MRGDGIRTADMNADPAIVLDVSRLISRLGQGPATGIDRVEAEWLGWLGQSGRPHLLLARTGRRQLLLPASAGPAILRWIAGDWGDLPSAGLLDRLRGRRDMRFRAQRALRRMAVLRADRQGNGLAACAQRRLTRATSYINVGHSNLDEALWSGLAPLRRIVLIHDTIPLDHPEFTRAGQSKKFRDRFTAALRHADLILTISRATRADVLRWREVLGLPDAAPVVAAPIGTRLSAPDAAMVPQDLDLRRPFFVTLGTIEPRKNHALLLDAWEELARRLPADKLPQLFIIGRRGWENRQTFARLDALPKGGRVHELAGLGDGAVAALVLRSHGLLMPSLSEGFGLPLTEAAARGVPVICTPTPAAKEILGDYARYLPGDDHRAWAGTVALLAPSLPLRLAPLAVPEWGAHFALAMAAIDETLLSSHGGAMTP